MEETIGLDNGDPWDIRLGVCGMASMLDETNEAEATQLQSPIDRLAVIVPVYNEERTVAELLRRLEAQPCVSQIIIVDDGSTDRTWEELEPWRARATFSEASSVSGRDALSVIVVQHNKNRGKGRAIRSGLEHVTCSHVLIQDADLEYDPADISRLWQWMQTGEADAVFGSRYLDNPRIQKGRWTMQTGVRFLNLLVRMLYGIKLTDEATCYKMFRTVDLFAMNLTCERFEFCPEVVAKAAVNGLMVREVQVDYFSRGKAAGKKIRPLDGVAAIWTLFRIKCGIGRVNSFEPRKMHPDYEEIDECVTELRSASISNSRIAAGWLPLILASIALSSAGAIKWHTQFTTFDSVLTINAGIAMSEILLAVLIASGFARQLVSIVTAATFSVFALYLIPMVLHGDSDCGCFGAISVSPFVTLGFDLTVLGLFLAFPPTHAAVHRPRFRIVWLIGLMSVAISTVAAAKYHVVVRSVATSTPYVVLQPNTWVGQPLPIVDSIKGGEQFAVGEWVLILHQSGCSACRDLREEYQNLGVICSEKGVGPRVAFVEVPYPGKPLSSPRAKPNDSYVVKWLDDATNWVAPTPVVLHLNDGIVIKVEQNSQPGSSRKFL